MIAFVLTWLALSVILAAVLCRHSHLSKIASGESDEQPR